MNSKRKSPIKIDKRYNHCIIEYFNPNYHESADKNFCLYPRVVTENVNTKIFEISDKTLDNQIILKKGEYSLFLLKDFSF